MARDISTRMRSILRYILFIMNSIFLLVGLLVIGVSIYLLLYKADLLSVIFERSYIRVSCVILIFCGSFLLVMAIIGLCGVATGNEKLLIAFVILMLLVALLAITAAIMGIIFRITWYIDELRLKMRDVLQQKYGTNMNNTDNQFITKVWDTVQQFWYCCGVEDSSWGIYRQSQWYNDQPGDAGTKEFLAKMVPESCCVKNQYGNYINLQKCQNWQLGPPNRQSATDRNEAVFYNGCFVIGRGLLVDIASGVIGLGIGVGVVMIVDAVLTFILVLGIHAAGDYPVKKKPYSSAYYMPQRNPGPPSDGDRSRDRSMGQVSPTPVELQPLDKSW